MLNAEDAVDTVSAANATLSSVYRVRPAVAAVAVLRI